MYIKSAPESLFEDMRSVWDALPRKGDEKVPQKNSLNPFHLKAHLSNIGIAEHLGGGQLTFRLLGTNSREFWGEELTGKQYDSLAEELPEGVMMPPQILEAIFNQPCGMKSRRKAEDKQGVSWLCDMLALPLADKAGEVKFLLYCYRIFPEETGQVKVGWEPGFADLSTAQLLSAEFVDISWGAPG